MADVQYWQDSLQDEISTIEDLINTIPSKSPMDKSRLLDQAERKIRSAQGTKRSFKMECRLVSDTAERRGYENQLSQYEQGLNALSSEVKSIRAESSKGELFLGANNDAQELNAEESGDALLKEASNIQDKTQGALDSIAKMTAEAKDVGMETMEEMRRQRDQITTIDEEAMKIEDNLKRADKLIRTFGRRMATDKLIQCFACLNIVLLVAVVVYSIIKRKGIPGDGFDNESGPLQPVRMLRGGLE